MSGFRTSLQNHLKQDLKAATPQPQDLDSASRPSAPDAMASFAAARRGVAAAQRGAAMVVTARWSGSGSEVWAFVQSANHVKTEDRSFWEIF